MSASLTHNAGSARKSLERVFDDYDKAKRNDVLDALDEGFERIVHRAPKRTGLYRESLKLGTVPPSGVQRQDTRGLSRRDIAKQKVGMALGKRGRNIVEAKAALNLARGRETNGIEFYISNDLYYAQFVERGTRHYKGHRTIGKGRTWIVRRFGKIGAVRR